MTNQERLKQANQVRIQVRKYYFDEGSEGVGRRLKKRGVTVTRDRIRKVASDMGVKNRDPEQGEKVKEAVKRYYEESGPKFVQNFLAQAGVKVGIHHIEKVASGLEVHYRDPENTELIKRTIGERYPKLGAAATASFLKENHGLIVRIPRIHHIASELEIKFQGERGKTLWSEEADKILIAVSINSRQYSPYTPEGHEKLRELKRELMDKLKSLGFRGNTGDNAISAHLRSINQERLNALGFTEMQAPLGWGSKSGSPHSKAMEKRISTRVEELILTGALKEDGSMETFRQRIIGEFVQEIERFKVDLSPGKFGELVDKLMWTYGTDGTLTALEEVIIKNRGDTTTFKQYYPYFPEYMVDLKAKVVTGITKVLHPAPFVPKAVRGVGCLLTEEEMKEGQQFELSPRGFGNPFVAAVKRGGFTVKVINGTNFGIKYNPVMEKNTSRRALAQAERDGCDLVVMSGLVDLDLTKASGHLKALRALVSGRDINVDILSPGYREEARRILQDLPVDEVIYETTREAFEGLMRGWWYVSRQPVEGDPENKEGNPEYSGQVLIILGPKEEELAIAAAHAAVVRNTIAKLNEIRAELAVATRSLKPYEKQLPLLQSKLLGLQARLESVQDVQERAGLEAEINKVSLLMSNLVENEINSRRQRVNELVDQEARTRVSNPSPQEWERFCKSAIAFVARKLEQAIPNSKVIGRGSTHVKVGGKIIEFCIPGHTQVTTHLMSDYVRTYGGRVRRRQMADCVVILHPYSLYYDVNTREVDSRGRRERAVQIIQAPICVDGAYLRERLANIVRKVHPIGKVVSSELFAPGVLQLNCSNGIINASTCSIEALGHYERLEIASPGILRRLKRLDDKYIWIMQNADEHIGGPSKEFVECKECKIRMGVGEAAFHLFRHAGFGSGEGKKILPIHMFIASDDGIQGYHFPWSNQPHHHRLSRDQMKDFLWNKLRQSMTSARTPEERNKIIDDAERMDMYQSEIRGEPWMEDQIREMKLSLERNADMFDSILQRFMRSGIRLKGVSEHQNLSHVPYDSRDVGAINLWNGNHASKTVDYHLMEGSIYADHLLMCLSRYPSWRDKTRQLAKLVRAPRDGNIFLGLGSIQASGGAMYGLEVCGRPQAGVNWTDLLQRQVATALRRGNIRRFFELMFVLWFCGNNHFLAQIRGPMDLWTMGAPGTHTDMFAEIAGGLPPNNTGVNFVGVPAAGPDEGSILLRALLYTDLRSYLEEKPRAFDMETFFPNPL